MPLAALQNPANQVAKGAVIGVGIPVARREGPTGKVNKQLKDGRVLAVGVGVLLQCGIKGPNNSFFIVWNYPDNASHDNRKDHN
jgi:hypothetical protein